MITDFELALVTAWKLAVAGWGETDELDGYFNMRAKPVHLSNLCLYKAGIYFDTLFDKQYSL